MSDTPTQIKIEYDSPPVTKLDAALLRLLKREGFTVTGQKHYNKTTRDTGSPNMVREITAVIAEGE